MTVHKTCALFVLLVLTLGCDKTVLAQATEGEEDPVLTVLDVKIDALFQNLADDGVTVEDALAEFLADSPLEKQAEAVKDLADRAKGLDKQFGQFVAAERVAAKRVGKDLVLLKYLYKAKNYPVVWYFTYYRDFDNTDPTDEAGNWKIIAVRFDTRLELLGL